MIIVEAEMVDSEPSIEEKLPFFTVRSNLVDFCFIFVVLILQATKIGMSFFFAFLMITTRKYSVRFRISKKSSLTNYYERNCFFSLKVLFSRSIR